MTIDPYQTPKAQIRGNDSTERAPKPKNVSWALNLILGSLGVGFAGVPLLVMRLPSEVVNAAFWSQFLKGAVPSVLSVLLLYFLLRAGFGWARWVYMILVAIGVVPGILLLRQIMPTAPEWGIANILQNIMQIFALVLLCSKSARAWYWIARVQSRRTTPADKETPLREVGF